MSWFDAHDALVMDMAAQDRIDELRSTADAAGAGAAPTDESPPDPDRCPNRPRSLVVWWRATITDERSAA